MCTAVSVRFCYREVGLGKVKVCSSKRYGLLMEAGVTDGKVGVCCS